jgi:UDPglucose 6-dehydrogenase
VPAGTGESIRRDMPGLAYVSCPEFLKEGTAVADFMHPDRVVVGADPGDEEAADAVAALYAPLGEEGEILRTDVASAEMIKLASNAFLATKISFINEIANVCEEVGADVGEVARGMGADTRIGSSFLRAGIGYGGSCFPKDVQALVKSSQEVSYDFRILTAVMDVNEKQKLHLMPKIKKYFKDNLKGRHFALWGLAFKPNTDDIREAPALYIIDALVKEGATITVFDPEAMNNVKQLIGDKVTYAENQYEALEKADALIIATEWNEFRTPNFLKIVTSLKNKVIFDGRNLFDIPAISDLGFYYESIGRAPGIPEKTK